MRELFKDKNPGDSLGAGHINKLNKVGRIVASQHPGAFTFGNEYGHAGPVPHVQRTVKVVNVENRYLYRCHPMYYDPDEMEPLDRWKTDDIGEGTGVFDYELDGILMGVELFVGDVLQAFWDPQRGAYMPSWVPYKMRFCRPPEDVDADSEGLFTFYKDGRDAPSIITEGAVAVQRWCYNADAAIDAETDCLAIHFHMMGLSGYDFDEEAESGQESASSASVGSDSSQSARSFKNRVEYEVVPLECS